MTFTAASANVGLWQFDRTTDELWATDHCRAMFGLASDVPLTRDTFLAAIHPDDRHIAIGALRQVRNARPIHRNPVRVMLAGKSDRAGSPFGRVRVPTTAELSNRFSGIFVDITDQKAAAPKPNCSARRSRI